MTKPEGMDAADVVEAQRTSERMPLFLTGWRYITTAEEADALPLAAVAIVDDQYLWDSLGNGPIVPNITPGCWDGVVDVQERDFFHGCEYSKCTPDTCNYYEWFETNDSKGSPRPPLPFFAWHPTFCVISGGSVGVEQTP